MFPSPIGFRAVQHTRELQRVMAIPRRSWSDEEAGQFARELTDALRKPGGKMGLRPIQAVALYEAATFGGLFGPIRVGGGKTLISLLLPFVMGSRRPLLLTRASLIEKTKREVRELAHHWPIPNFVRIESYEKLGRVSHSTLLDVFRPDLIVADECHRVKNRKAAVTRRVSRYMHEHPETQFAAISGTITRKSLLEWAHVARWCLKNQAPVPGEHHWSELEEWSAALDEKGDENEVKPGALFFFCNEEERQDPDTLNGVRRAFRRRLVDTGGVVATTEGFLGASLSIQALETDMDPDVDAAFSKLRSSWFTPDDWPISDPMTLNRHARELALGFFYVWDPRPPRDWLDARKEWAATCRDILGDNRRNLDSELQVTQAVDAGHYPDAVRPLAAWRVIKPTFVPNTIPVWLDESALDLAATWAQVNGPGIVWCEHVAFAEKLAAKTGLAYYGERGQDRLGRAIEAHPADQSLIASVASNSEGRNLQKWSRNLITSCPASDQTLEQLLARTHRDGQAADEVTAEVILTCAEHAQALDHARRQARYIEASTGQAQKLVYADVTYPDLETILATRSGARWIK